MANENEDVQAPGWDAITAVCEKLYPGQEPKHFGPAIPPILGGEYPLNGISAYKRLDPIPHWHFVTYGFSELFEEPGDDPEYSGFGFELTFRLATEATSEEPPMWPMEMLQRLARHIFNTGCLLLPGHWINAGGSIALGEDTLLCSVGVVADPELPEISTPNGIVEFLQLVGLTQDEEFAAKKWNVGDLLDMFLPAMPLWITDLHRASLLDQPEMKENIHRETEKEGSSTASIWTDALIWDYQKRLLRTPLITVEISAKQVAELIILLPLRINFKRDFGIRGPEFWLRFKCGSTNKVTCEEQALVIELTADSAHEIAGILRPNRGSYPIPSFPGLTFEVLPTEIRDQQGNVTAVIG